MHFVMHNMSKTLQDTPVGQKNVSVLECLEDIAVQLDALRVTFCKSGKDRTGMAVTLEQSRYMARKFGIGTNNKDIVIHNANIMREYGTRLDVVEKNIKKRCYAINAIQATFLPEEFLIIDYLLDALDLQRFRVVGHFFKLFLREQARAYKLIELNDCNRNY